MIQKPPVPFSQEFRTVHQLIRREITNERERQRELRAKGARGIITLVILVASISINVSLYFFSDTHPALFIIASYLLFMVYFITLFIPMDKQYRHFKGLDITNTLLKLRRLGIIRSTDRLSRVFINAFFANCRTLFYGFALFFSLDIIFAIDKYFDGTFTLQTTWIVIIESAAIVLFYYLVWRLEPYSPEFFRDVHGMKTKLVTKKIPPLFVTFLLSILGVLAITGMFAAVVLLPGITLQKVMSVDNLEQVSNLFIHIGILLLTQYFILRYIHGITSLSMATRFSEMKEKYLIEQIDGVTEPEMPGGEDLSPTAEESDALRENTAILLESRIYQIRERTILGTFPVYIINPDLQVVIEEPTLATISGLSQERAGTHSGEDNIGKDR
jgi:hypothetical protein